MACACGCPRCPEPAPAPGAYRKLAAYPEQSPDPRIGSLQSRKGYFGSNVSPLTLARQRLQPTPEAPLQAQQGNVAPISGVTGSAVETARRGLALQIGTVFRQAVQYVIPWVPVPQPLTHNSYLQVGQMLPPDRALEMPRYSFAAIDSEALLNAAKAHASSSYGRR